MLKLINQLQIPLAAPSANKFKSTSPTTAQHVEDEFQGQVPVVDGGGCGVGIESTILEVLNLNTIKIYRPGIITKEKIQVLLAPTPWKDVTIYYEESNVAPGQLKEHYRPKKPITLYLTSSAFLIPLNQNNIIPNLPTDVTLAARVLYSLIRDTDQNSKASELKFYFPMHLWTDNSWYPIRERLEKACSKIIINQ